MRGEQGVDPRPFFLRRLDGRHVGQADVVFQEGEIRREQLDLALVDGEQVLQHVEDVARLLLPEEAPHGPLVEELLRHPGAPAVVGVGRQVQEVAVPLEKVAVDAPHLALHRAAVLLDVLLDELLAPLLGDAQHVALEDADQPSLGRGPGVGLGVPGADALRPENLDPLGELGLRHVQARGPVQAHVLGDAVAAVAQVLLALLQRRLPPGPQAHLAGGVLLLDDLVQGLEQPVVGFVLGLRRGGGLRAVLPVGSCRSCRTSRPPRSPRRRCRPGPAARSGAWPFSNTRCSPGRSGTGSRSR